MRGPAEAGPGPAPGRGPARWAVSNSGWILLQRGVNRDAAAGGG